MSLVPYTVVLLLATLGVTRCYEAEEVVTIVTDNLAHYEADITYTIQHFKELPLTENYFSYETPSIPSRSPRGVQWNFVVLPANLRHGSHDFGLILNLKALPENTKSFEVTTECSIIGQNGQREKTHRGKETFLESRGSFVWVDFAARSELDTEANGLLRDGHLTVNCKIEGLITPLENVHELIPTVEVERKSVPSNRSYVNDWSSNCTIAEDTLNRLATYDFELHGDAVLKSSGEQIQLHKDILSDRSSAFKKLLEQSSFVDFGNELGVEELNDLSRFLYEGSAPGLKSSCFKLHKIAKEYQVQCLTAACEEALIEGLNQDNARQTLTLALKNEAPAVARAAAVLLSKKI